MGRETKLLLGLLATLLGVFVGVLSMKLLVPRPPDGAGPDVHADVAATETQDLVEPPHLAGGEDLPPAPATASANLPPPAEFDTPRSRFAPRPAGAAAPPPVRDPFVSTVSVDQPVDMAPRNPSDQTAETAAQPPTGAPLPARFEPVAPPVSGSPPTAVGSAYVARPGDSWWSLAERSYGDGRLYRALFAWNRAVDPRVSLVPGTSIEIPPAERLQAAWPGLLPKD